MTLQFNPASLSLSLTDELIQSGNPINLKRKSNNRFGKCYNCHSKENVIQTKLREAIYWVCVDCFSKFETLGCLNCYSTTPAKKWCKNPYDDKLPKVCKSCYGKIFTELTAAKKEPCPICNRVIRVKRPNPDPDKVKDIPKVCYQCYIKIRNQKNNNTLESLVDTSQRPLKKRAIRIKKNRINAPDLPKKILDVQPILNFGDSLLPSFD